MKCIKAILSLHSPSVAPFWGLVCQLRLPFLFSSFLLPLPILTYLYFFWVFSSMYYVLCVISDLSNLNFVFAVCSPYVYDFFCICSELFVFVSNSSQLLFFSSSQCFCFCFKTLCYSSSIYFFSEFFIIFSFYFPLLHVFFL